MAYVPTFATRYLRDCVEQDMDPRVSLDAWMMRQQRQRHLKEGDGIASEEPVITGGMGCISSADHSLPTKPQTLSPTHCTTPKANKNLPSKDTEPFIAQTSPIFRELISGHATGEVEEEDSEEQDDRKVHGFVYTRQGKRRTVFRGELPKPEHRSIPIPKFEESVTISLPETKRPERMVRTYKVPRMRRGKQTTSTPQEGICKLCTTYVQLRSCEAVSAAVPDIPVKCGPCLRKEMRGKRTAVEKSSAESGAVLTSKIMPRPEPTSRLRIVMKKGPPEAPAGNDQMALQMLADVQRTPKRVRRVPGRLLEI